MFEKKIRAGILSLAVLLSGCSSGLGGGLLGGSAENQNSDKLFGDISIGETQRQRSERLRREESEQTEPPVSVGQGQSVIERAGLSESARESARLPNVYLWRGALDVVGVLPLQTLDRNAGVILTDWYSPTTAKNLGEGSSAGERYRLSVFVLTPGLRSMGVRVVPFRQIRSDGEWIDVVVSDSVAQAITDRILVRSHQMRMATTPAIESSSVPPPNQILRSEQ